MTTSAHRRRTWPSRYGPGQQGRQLLILWLPAGDVSEVLADPMCGSGTLLIEAALMATHTAPGLWRDHWPFFRCAQGLQSARL